MLKLILSNCFDSFIYNGKLTVTFRVEQRNDINALDLADFVSSAARIVSNNNPEDVSVKTTIHSCGDILLQIANYVKDNPISLVILYVAIFGGKIGDYELCSITGLVKNILDRDYNKTKKRLELRKLTAEVDIAEQDAISKKLDNEERQYKIRLALADAYAEQLNSAAMKLEIRPESTTLIDIAEIIKKNKPSQEK